MSMDECSDSESGTLSGSENGAVSDCSSEPHCECEGAKARQCRESEGVAPSRSSVYQRPAGGWCKPPLRARQLHSSDQDSEEEPHVSKVEEQRWRVAGSRLASIFKEHSDSEGMDVDAKPQDEECWSVTRQQEQRWRVAGKRLAAVFQAHSDSDDAPRALRQKDQQ